jgi:hypothetical protein
MKKIISSLLPAFVLLLTSCGNQQMSTQSPIETATPDPCSSENLPDTIQVVNELTREFDDASQLASNLPAPQLPDIISNMQRIRRAAEDLEAPACLTTLKTHQLNHMNGMIQTLLSFVGGADQATLNNGMTAARQEHEQYSLEVVKLLGITLEPKTATPPGPGITSTPTPTVTP